MPAYTDLDKKIKSWNKNYAAVLAAVNKAKQKSQWSFIIATLGGAVAIALAITAIVVQSKYDTVGKAMQMAREHFAAVTALSAAHDAMCHAIISDLAG